MPGFTRLEAAMHGAAPAAGVQFVGKSTTYVASAGAATHTQAFIAAASGTNRKLLVGVAMGSGASIDPDLLTVTYNGQALALGASATVADETAKIFYLDHAAMPTDGLSHDIVLAGTGGNPQPLFGAVELSGVAQGAPTQTGTDTGSSGAAVSIALTGVAEGAIVVDCATNNGDTTFASGANQEVRHAANGVPAANTIVMSDKIGVSAGNVTMTQDAGGGGTQYVAAEWAKA